MQELPKDIRRQICQKTNGDQNQQSRDNKGRKDSKAMQDLWKQNT